MHIKEVNPHFEDFLFDWEQEFQFRWKYSWVGNYEKVDRKVIETGTPEGVNM